jgi:hypothetical protein
MSSFTVEKLPDEPIILVTVIGFLDVNMARSIYAQIAEIAATLQGPLYRITDVRQEHTSFVELVGVIKEASKGTAGTTTDPRIKNVFVGNEKMARVARDALVKNLGAASMPMFATMEDALEHIRNELNDLSKASNG